MDTIKALREAMNLTARTQMFLRDTADKRLHAEAKRLDETLGRLGDLLTDSTGGKK